MNCIKYKSKIGNIYITADNESLTGISFYEQKQTCSNEIIERTIKQLHEYFNAERKIFDLPIKLIGTEFQKKVWLELAKIPYGQTRTYKQIAQAIGNKNASRAVGNANNKNPIAIVIPCHRVIGTNKKLVGYAGGVDKKQFLLDIEKIQ